MKKYLITTLLIFAVCIAMAQTKPDSTTVFDKVDVSAEFPGGVNALGMFLGRNVRYPSDSYEKNIQGKVLVSFIIERDGNLSDIKITKHVSKDIDAEAIRIIKSSPKWIPGKQGDIVVRQRYTVPINFTLAKN
ncbi:energy transducer TonB [Mucilaginibacter mali]|uniref:Energy transducer TonB n=1 Tax=Mucilaginibacter mali TaxID=2740462 RepID=A0A7D4QIE2_9SPHI|nr:energy transducer TonB [Mucilaginibacter mali]QKJ29050.1 energy transducer TonB [Mucilaginibacter mali]